MPAEVCNGESRQRWQRPHGREERLGGTVTPQTRGRLGPEPPQSTVRVAVWHCAPCAAGTAEKTCEAGPRCASRTLSSGPPATPQGGKASPGSTSLSTFVRPACSPTAAAVGAEAGYRGWQETTPHRRSAPRLWSAPHTDDVLPPRDGVHPSVSTAQIGALLGPRGERAPRAGTTAALLSAPTACLPAVRLVWG